MHEGASTLTSPAGDEARGVEISRTMFARLLAELARRGQGCRESGAFLLSRREGPFATRTRRPTRVVAAAYYDDLDAASLTGGIVLGANGYAALNARCRAEGLRVVADVHTHPGVWVAQSNIDAAHPMSARTGHIALIAPNYARGRITLENLGVHIFTPPGWTSYFGNQVPHIVALTGSRRIAWLRATFRTVLRQIRSVATERRCRERAGS